LLRTLLLESGDEQGGLNTHKKFGHNPTRGGGNRQLRGRVLPARGALADKDAKPLE